MPTNKGIGDSSNNREGTNWLLVIGINNYIDPSVPKLNNPVNDAKRLTGILTEHYEFTLFRHLNDEDATRTAIIETILDLQNQLTADDNLIIFFSGHGYRRQNSKNGYIVPVDGQNNRTTNYISFDDLKARIDELQMHHFLFILDCCYAGSALRNLGEKTEINKPSRRILAASSSDEPAADGFYNMNSPFTAALAEILEENKELELPVKTLYVKLRDLMEAKGVKQFPVEGTWTMDGNRNGELIFLKKSVLINQIKVLEQEEESKLKQEKYAYEFAKKTNTSYELLRFLREFPKSIFFNDIEALYSQKIEEDKDKLVSINKQLGARQILSEIEEGKKSFKEDKFMLAFQLLYKHKDYKFFDGEAQFYLASMYETSQGVLKDNMEALKWYRKAAEQGNSNAQVYLGLMYEDGENVEQNFKEAAIWYQKAAEQGNPDGQANLGSLFENGNGVEQSYIEAIKWYQKSAESGNSKGQFYLKSMNEHSEKQDYIDALDWYESTAELGNIDFQNNLGFFYQNGYCVKQDFSMAKKWYEKAAEGGNSKAQVNLGDCFLTGLGVETDEIEAVKWYRKAADQGDARGQANLGNLYFKGCEGLEKNINEALKLFKIAAENGNHDAQFCLGLLYFTGAGLPQDFSESMKWYRKSAEQGNVSGQVNLGIMYENGINCNKDDNEAFKWYKKAAEKGHALGQAYLGDMYENGVGVDKDLNEAIRLFHLAAVQGNQVAIAALERTAKEGHALAQAYWGDIYENGTGIDTDLNEAIKFYRLASAQKNLFAKEALKRLKVNE